MGKGGKRSKGGDGGRAPRFQIFQRADRPQGSTGITDVEAPSPSTPATPPTPQHRHVTIIPKERERKPTALAQPEEAAPPPAARTPPHQRRETSFTLQTTKLLSGDESSFIEGKRHSGNTQYRVVGVCGCEGAGIVDTANNVVCDILASHGVSEEHIRAQVGRGTPFPEEAASALTQCVVSVLPFGGQVSVRYVVVMCEAFLSAQAFAALIKRTHTEGKGARSAEEVLTYECMLRAAWLLQAADAVVFCAHDADVLSPLGPLGGGGALRLFADTSAMSQLFPQLTASRTDRIHVKGSVKALFATLPTRAEDTEEQHAHIVLQVRCPPRSSLWVPAQRENAERVVVGLCFGGEAQFLPRGVSVEGQVAGPAFVYVGGGGGGGSGSLGVHLIAHLTAVPPRHRAVALADWPQAGAVLWNALQHRCPFLREYVDQLSQLRLFMI